METKGHELNSEAAIFAEGTPYTGAYLATAYLQYVADCRAGDGSVDDFQRWIASNFPSCCKQV